MARVKREVPSRDIGAMLRSGGIRKPKARRVGGKPIGKARISSTRRFEQMPIRKQITIPIAERTFDPQRYGMHAIDDNESGLRRLETDPQSIVIAVQGACINNGFYNAQAAYGVFVSNLIPRLNEKGPLPAQYQQTSQSAELHAAMEALEIVIRFVIAGEDITHVIIKTDSEYLERGLSSCVWKWTGNGFKNWRGQPVVNGRAFKYLHEKVVLLEKDYGMRVSFCRVPKGENGTADRLAREALNLDHVRERVANRVPRETSHKVPVRKRVADHWEPSHKEPVRTQYSNTWTTESLHEERVQDGAAGSWWTEPSHEAPGREVANW